ncbi:hypothetical protein TIFTF001_007562 [Ficus carica]|uniref:Uncharacterized protein n=1 Tax=Ficus carica TaxID=3494 RepID=A0AA88D100_FICCA|nr:hypothetical protein TIFTF001_007562 [Ficus carica]
METKKARKPALLRSIGSLKVEVTIGSIGIPANKEGLHFGDHFRPSIQFEPLDAEAFELDGLELMFEVKGHAHKYLTSSLFRNAMFAVSLAVCKAGASVNKLDLFRVHSHPAANKLALQDMNECLEVLNTAIGNIGLTGKCVELYEMLKKFHLLDLKEENKDNEEDRRTRTTECILLVELIEKWGCSCIMATYNCGSYGETEDTVVADLSEGLSVVGNRES